MSATAFQRRRREIARLRAEAEQNGQAEQENSQTDQNADGENQSDEKQVNAENSPENDELTIDQVKEKLTELGISFAHNTGETKLREKLANANE